MVLRDQKIEKRAKQGDLERAIATAAHGCSNVRECVRFSSRQIANNRQSTTTTQLHREPTDDHHIANESTLQPTAAHACDSLNAIIAGTARARRCTDGSGAAGCRARCGFLREISRASPTDSTEILVGSPPSS
jgi:hypothetical protein